MHVVRHGCLAAAARELGVDPSAVSRALATLEGEHDTRLFQRNTRQLASMEACSAFVDRLALVFEELAQACIAERHQGRSHRRTHRCGLARGKSARRDPGGGARAAGPRPRGGESGMVGLAAEATGSLARPAVHPLPLRRAGQSRTDTAVRLDDRRRHPVGDLVDLHPDHAAFTAYSPSMSWVVFPSHSHVPAKVRVFTDCLHGAMPSGAVGKKAESRSAGRACANVQQSPPRSMISIRASPGEATTSAGTVCLFSGCNEGAWSTRFRGVRRMQGRGCRRIVVIAD